MKSGKRWLVGLVLGAALGAGACEEVKEKKEQAEEIAAQTKEGAEAVVDKTKEGAGVVVDKTKEGAGVVVDKTKEGADLVVDKTKAGADLVVDKTKGGASSAVDWLKGSPEMAKGGIETLVTKGGEVSPVLKEMVGLLKDAVDSETTIQPIYQEVSDPDAQAELDAAIGDMPRTEEIEGVTVGYKSIDATDEGKNIKERGYLVVWRRDNHLIGFLYRTKREIDLDEIARRAPVIIKTIEAAL